MCIYFQVKINNKNRLQKRLFPSERIIKNIIALIHVEMLLVSKYPYLSVRSYVGNSIRDIYLNL